ncbi:hypothetical protein IWX76_000334 [Pedobacter sp. CAN_A7]|uniref:hypothetical protein n=1 Tax=Pedobacter sp. CAN_A7 TaxID=2787722 RepID=UPI0018CACE10
MLKPYKIQKHDIHKIQSFVNHLVIDVLCKPHISDQFSSLLLLPKYRDLVDNVNDEYILKPISESFLICKNVLKKKDLKLLKSAVLNNNQIRKLCTGELNPVLYEDIINLNADLAKYLKVFCDHLYKHSINLEAFYSVYGKVESYYRKFAGADLTCRFCGIGNILGQFHSKRSALDHYFPKGLFPFSSVNFKNLIPICDTCNSKYKLEQNPIRTPKKKKGKGFIGNEKIKTFYPFRRDTPDIDITISLSKTYGIGMAKSDMNITFSCIGFDEEVRNWERLFGISENYIAFCCSNDMLMYYEEQYVALKNEGIQHDKYIGMLKKNRYSDKNVIKIPFLEAIQP